MTWLLRGDSEFAIIERLAQESDRAVAIIAATISEDRVTWALRSFFRDSPKVVDELFRHSGPLGSFATKINVAFLMGVYDEEAHRELITIKDIRNEFAHKISVEDFESQSVSDKVKNLRIPEKYIGKTLGDLVEQPHLKTVLYKQPPENVRERFLIATQIYIILLSHAADKSQGAAPHTPRF